MSPLVGMTRAVLLAVGTAVVAALALLRFGAPWHWAVLVALPVGSLVLLGSRLPRATDVVWSPPPASVTGATSPQAGALASRLAEAAVDQDRFARRVQPRLRRLAEARLRQAHGVHDLDDPRARAILGAELHRLLTDPRAPMPEPKKLADLLENL